MNSAFQDIVRCSDDYFTVDAPEYHSGAYVTGGIGHLYHMIKHDGVPALPEIGYHTDSNGHFDPKGKCLLGLRYKVVKILDAKGQSAVLVEAEDQFCSSMPVVIKVLHSHYYQLGGQESHVLRKLAVADPHNYSHTLRLLTTLTMDTHYCLVFEPMLPDPLTHSFSYIPSPKKLADIRRVGLRLLTSISFLHQQNLIHTDLKPENILLKHEQDLDSVHIVDFGNAINFVHSEVSLYYKDFELQTPLYRAPEVMFGIPFGPEIDIWSLGCILAELYLGKPLFLGNTQEEILKQMHKLLGSFPTKLFRRGKYYPTMRKFTGDEAQDVCTFRLMEFMQCNDHNFADLISGMLRYNPEERLTASQAAIHPFFASHIPLGFLSPGCQGGSPYSAVSLTKETYQFTPHIPPSIKRQPLSSVDLLKQGTVENLDKSLIKPSPKLSRLRGSNLCATTKGDNLYVTSRGNNFGENSGFTEPVSEPCAERINSMPGRNPSSDASVVKNLIVGAKRGEKYSENVKDKMSSLLQAIREEQLSVDDDLDRRIEAEGPHNLKNKNKDKIPSIANLQRPCPRYGKLGQIHNNVEDSHRIHSMSQTIKHREGNNEIFSSVNADTSQNNKSRTAFRSGKDCYEKLENVLKIQEDNSHLRQNLLPRRFEESKTVSCWQNSNRAKSDNISYDNDDASPTSTSYCSGNGNSMDTENNSFDRSGAESQKNDTVDRNRLKYQVITKRKLKSENRSLVQFSKIGKHSHSNHLSRQIDGLIHSHKKDFLHSEPDGKSFQCKEKSELNSLHHKHNAQSSSKTDTVYGRVNRRKIIPNTSDGEMSTIPFDQSPQRTNRKRMASVSVSDDEEYLELLSTPSMVKSDRKKVKSGSLTKRRQYLDITSSNENVGKSLETVAIPIAYKKVSPQIGDDAVSNVSKRHNESDRSFQYTYSNICDNDDRKMRQRKPRECDGERNPVAPTSDLKPSARFHGNNYPQDFPVFTPIQKQNPLVTDCSDSPEIIYNVAQKQACHTKSNSSDHGKSLTYQGSVQSDTTKAEMKHSMSQKYCPNNMRDYKSHSDILKSERKEQVISVDRRTNARTLVQDFKTEDSKRDDFSFRDTPPDTDYKHFNAAGGIAERIAQINKKRKKPARKSLHFQYSDSDVQHVEDKCKDRYNDLRRNRSSVDNDSELLHIHGTKDSLTEKDGLRDRFRNRVANKETRISNCRLGDCAGELHDRVTNAHISPESQRDINPMSRQRSTVNARSERTNFWRKYIPKNDTTFTIDFESPIH